MNIQEIINLELQKEQLSKQGRERSGKYSPSLLGGCYRKQYWNRINEPQSNPPDERSLRKFKAGNLFEKFAVDLAIKQNPSLLLQVKVEDNDFLGFADIVNGEEVIDIKSIHSKGFWYMEKSKDIREDKYNNWMQVLFYAWKLNKKYGKLCFISKDDLTIAEYRQELDDYWLNELDLEITKLQYYSSMKTIPPAYPRLYNGKECDFCQFKNTCELKEKNNPQKGVIK